MFVVYVAMWRQYIVCVSYIQKRLDFLNFRLQVVTVYNRPYLLKDIHHCRSLVWTKGKCAYAQTKVVSRTFRVWERQGIDRYRWHYRYSILAMQVMHVGGRVTSLFAWRYFIHSTANNMWYEGSLKCSREILRRLCLY